MVWQKQDHHTMHIHYTVVTALQPVLSSLVARVIVLRKENYDPSLIHRLLNVCHLLNTISIKREYCQCLPICNSCMPVITTSQLINITHFNTTKCDYYYTLSKHFMERTMCHTNKNEFQGTQNAYLSFEEYQTATSFEEPMLHSSLEQSSAKESISKVQMEDQKHEYSSEGGNNHYNSATVHNWFYFVSSVCQLYPCIQHKSHRLKPKGWYMQMTVCTEFTQVRA